MRPTTDFVGHLDIAPALNAAEISYVTAFGAPAPGRPGFGCLWEPCPDGCCLILGERENGHDPVPWLRYLIRQFLKPGALASRSGLGCFSRFTFDHRLDGVVVGHRRESRELTAITVRANRVTTRTLRGPDPEYAASARRSEPPRRGGPSSNVIDLRSRFPGRA